MEKQQVMVRIWIGLLTFTAGFLNGGCVLFFASAVGHQSGNICKFSLAAAQNGFFDGVHLLLFPSAFFAGAFTAGLIFYERNLVLSKRYGILIMAFAVVFIGLAVFKPPAKFCLLISCWILGIQNGMFIFYKGILVRTTHITGYITDAAFSLGMICRGKPNELVRVLFYAISILLFIFGTYCCVLAGMQYFFYTAAMLYFLSGVCYFVYRLRRNSLC